MASRYLRVLVGALLLARLAPAVNGQEAGERLWSVHVEAIVIDGQAVMGQPRVAPDGTVYLVTNQLYAISPAGDVLWTAPAYASYVDLGPDGTIYAAGGSTVFAYWPDGSLRWSFTESPAGQGIMQGPTVGPDGNVYAISDLGGIGAFSLTPEGDFRWSVPGFSNNSGVGLGRIQFGPDNLYFAEDWVPGCEPLTSGLVAITLDGDVDWCIPLSGVSRPWAGPDGIALMSRGGSKMLEAYDRSGEIAWTHTFGGGGMGIGSVVVGPDNRVYAFHAASTLASLTSEGSLRWEQEQPINNFPWRPAVSPDGRAVVSGSVYGFGQNGRIIAADAADGSTLWSIDVSGPMAGAGAPAEFSPDGTVVYVPVNTVDFDDPDALWAIRVYQDRLQPEEPASGAVSALSAAFPNPFATWTSFVVSLAKPQDLEVAVFDALGRRVRTIFRGAASTGDLTLTLDAAALAPGVYVVRVWGEDFSAARAVTLVR